LYFDNTILLIIPALIITFYAQHKVKSAYKKYSKVNNNKGYTGADIARQLLLTRNIMDVKVVPVHGELTDHYDPKSKVVRLSEGVYNSTSLAAVGIAAHEVGHAIQHNTGYGPLGLRSALVPMANIGSKLGMPLVFIGLIFAMGPLLDIGIILYSLAVLFTLITLPVEFNASNRAIELLSEYHFIMPNEIVSTKKVLNAAALTYVAAALSAILTLLRLVLLANRRR